MEFLKGANKKYTSYLSCDFEDFKKVQQKKRILN